MPNLRVLDDARFEDHGAPIIFRKESIVGRSKTGEAISAERKTPEAIAELSSFLRSSESDGDVAAWKRAKGVLGYIKGKRVIELCEQLEVVRGSVNQWLRWYETRGVEGLRTRKAPGGVPRLSEAQRAELSTIVEAGPQQAGFTSGMWTGPMIGDLIRARFGVSYHNHHIPRLLHQLGFSVQRPRKRLARADAASQATWFNERLPAIKKKQQLAVAS